MTCRQRLQPLFDQIGNLAPGQLAAWFSVNSRARFDNQGVQWIVFFLVVLFRVLLTQKATAPANPWNEWADTLEWTLPSPPPEHTFETLPKRSDWDRTHAH